MNQDTRPLESKFKLQYDKFYRVTKYMALDCEMDLNVTGMTQEQRDQATMCSKNPGLVVKVSLVNSLGETVLDTLVDFLSYQVYKTVPCPEKVEIKTEE